jgi:hypothetical protein
MNMTYEVSFKKPEKRTWHQWGVNSIEEARNPPPLSKEQAEKIAERYRADGYETMLGSNSTDYFSS